MDEHILNAAGEMCRRDTLVCPFSHLPSIAATLLSVSRSTGIRPRRRTNSRLLPLPNTLFRPAPDRNNPRRTGTTRDRNSGNERGAEDLCVVSLGMGKEEGVTLYLSNFCLSGSSWGFFGFMDRLLLPRLGLAVILLYQPLQDLYAYSGSTQS